MNFSSSIAHIFLAPWGVSTFLNFCSHAYFILIMEEQNMMKFVTVRNRRAES